MGFQSAGKGENLHLFYVLHRFAVQKLAQKRAPIFVRDTRPAATSRQATRHTPHSNIERRFYNVVVTSPQTSYINWLGLARLGLARLYIIRGLGAHDVTSSRDLSARDMPKGSGMSLVTFL